MARNPLVRSVRWVVVLLATACMCVLPAFAGAASRPRSATPEAAAPPIPLAAPVVQSAPAIQGHSAVVAHIPVGSDPFGIAVNPTTHRVYVANRDGYSVSVIDGLTRTVAATVPVGAQPWAQVAVDAKTNRAYVVNNGSGSLSVIDGGSNTVIATVANAWSAPEGVAVHTGLGRVYVAHSANLLSVVDATSHAISDTLQTGTSNHSVVVNENADRAYVCRTDPYVTSVMDLQAGTKIGEIAASGFMAFNAETNRLYIDELESAAVTVIDTTNNARITRVGIESGNGSPAVNVKTNCVYAPNPGRGTVSVIDGASNTVVGTISGLHGSVFAAAADPEAGLVYVTERDSNTVAVIVATSCSADPEVTPTVTPTPTATYTPSPTPTATHTPTPVPGAIHGRAWYDASGDGKQDVDEPGLYGVRVSLYRSGLMIGQEYTRGDGLYRFGVLPPAQYVVREGQPRWLKFSTSPDEVQVSVPAGGEGVVDFGDWEGRSLYLPLIRPR